MEKERKKAEKQAKFDAKNKKQASTTSTAPSKSKEKKAQAEKKAEKEVLPPYQDDTPPGQKKSTFELYPKLIQDNTDLT